ncbi:MAG: hypothetical protein HKN82_18210 [Akkermansiaceae bacterium]|nr:hypothetical protein [Akkermansiaceae bacterium]NNM30212.1 hypothetical protein [Akkermansiaceae bacterium]
MRILEAPHPGATPVNQLRVSGNACGPAALLSAFGFGSERWQAVAAAVPGRDDRQRIGSVIRLYGAKDSAHLRGRKRWNQRSGVNLLDLTDIANEMAGGRSVPRLDYEVLVQKRRESQAALLRRAHRRLARSLKRGMPPVISLRRLALRSPPGTDQKFWTLVRGHFAVVTAIPARLPRGARSFGFRYADPWGGEIHEGRFEARESANCPCLVAIVPRSTIGKRDLNGGESSIVTLAAAIGDF